VDAKFCSECGTGLRQAPSPSPATTPVSGEKKHITVLFADVAGSMDLQERLDPEVWAQIMGRFVSILAEGVRKFGGTVDKFTGDGIMALFGAPIAQEDHARRACHAGWHLTKAIGEWSEELRRDHGIELQVRLGLNSGEVVVGRVGDDVTLDPTALGHTVGLAQRMEAMAGPGEAYLTERTARLVGDWFQLEDLGRRPVKGASEPLRVHALGAPRSAPLRRTVGAAPLVGRQRELAALKDALALARDGQFQVVGVVGEAGVGKSRLCEDFVRASAADGVTVRRGSGVSHGRDIPLLPVLAMVRDYFGVTEADDPSEARDRVSRLVLEGDPALEVDLPVLLDFLEVADPAAPPLALAPEIRMRRTFTVLRRLIKRRTADETLILLLEDLHWFDQQSEAFLDRLVESYPGSRTLVVANFRPEFSAPWMRHSYYRQLPLAPLPERAAGELLRRLCGNDSSLDPLFRLVQERTGGNPFFAEEVVRGLVEDGALEGHPGDYRFVRPLGDLEIPPSVRAVLAARIDRLPPEDKAVLQCAAVIGRTFDVAVLGAVTGLTTDRLAEALGVLSAAELLQEVSKGSAVEYRFWHPLTQEVAYGSLLSEPRQRFHAAVAEALAVESSDRLDEVAAVLAWHWQQAGQPLHSARWNMRAAGWAFRRDVGEARRRLVAAIQLLRAVEETPLSLELGVVARIRLIQSAARSGATAEEMERLFEEARALAERLGRPGLTAMAILFAGTASLMRGDFAGSYARYVEGCRLAEASGDPDVIATAVATRAVIAAFIGPLSEGFEWADRILADPGANPDWGVSLVSFSATVRTMEFRVMLCMRAGRLEEGRDSLRQTLQLVRTRNEFETLGWTLSHHGELAWHTGEDENSFEAASEALKIAEDMGNIPTLVSVLAGLAAALLATGRPAEAAAACERGLSEARAHESGRIFEGQLLAYLGRARLDAGDLAGALASSEEAVAVARHQQAPVVECLALLIRGQTWRAHQKDAEAEADLAAALDLATETGALGYEPFIREELGRLHHDEKELGEALRLYRQIGATGHARRLEAELSTRPTR
jgi:adenylate cyclase